MTRNRISIIIFSAIVSAALSLGNLSWAAVNYGTTTYFSGTEDELPPVSEPILDPGGSVPNWRPGDTRKDDDSGDDRGGGILDTIKDALDYIFGDGRNSPGDYQPVDKYERGSLFDFQKIGSNNSSENEYYEAYIMGPRGESLEEDEAAYKNKLAQNFNFGSGEKEVAPKRSKLIFTNVEVPLDLTTQYVLLGIVFFVAIGGAVGYYLWKKEKAEENTKYNRDEE